MIASRQNLLRERFQGFDFRFPRRASVDEIEN